jgi:outer membrane lipoprotein-sorting protein
MKTVRQILVSALLILFLGFSQSKAFALTATFDQKISQSGNPTPIAVLKIAIKEKKVRVEATPENTFFQNEKGFFNYFPAQKMALQLPVPPANQNPAEDLSNFGALLKNSKAVLKGSETVGSYACDIYEFQDPRTNLVTKAWVWKEKQFPIKMEIQSPRGPILMEFTNLKMDEHLDDSLFELPEGVKIQQLPGYPGTPSMPLSEQNPQGPQNQN